MNAIWSFWSRPFVNYYHTIWLTPRLHALCWALSLAVARRHFESTTLVTDDDGAELLIEKLGLQFDEVSVGLNVIGNKDPKWFGLGKLYAYRERRDPFLHIDNDVFLWKGLPRQACKSPVIAQCWEPFRLGDRCYRIERLEHALRVLGGVLPPEIEQYVPRPSGFRAVNCGILGGNDISFLHQYAEVAIDVIENARNQPAWEAVGTDTLDSVMVEQFTLAACLCHRNSEAGLHVLFETLQDAYEREQSDRVGYTHLIGRCKRNAVVAARIDELVARIDPKIYERCNSCFLD